MTILKKSILIMVLFLLFTLSGCGTSETDKVSYYVLPNLNDRTKEEILEIMDRNNQSFEIVIFDQVVEKYQNEFVMYGDGYNTGDVVSNNDVITIIVYPKVEGVDENDSVFITLPDLVGLKEPELTSLLDELNVVYTLDYQMTFSESFDGLFITYSGYNSGDLILEDEGVIVTLYQYNGVNDDTSVDCEAYPFHVDCIENGNDIYYTPESFDYDGPYLDLDFYESYDYLGSRGGYFEVTLKYCTDGDTAVFNYPQEVYDSITSGAKSVRFLNIDTEETYSGGEEEWGKPASVYTCNMLETASSIILQTDPNDGLTDTYGRLLAWVWIDIDGSGEYVSLNYMLTRQGLASVKYEFGGGETIYYNDYTYNEWMHIGEDYAELNDIGMHGDLLDYYWNYELDEPYYDRWN
jgi:endonuclease YncB( thermonuclease family)